MHDNIQKLKELTNNYFPFDVWEENPDKNRILLNFEFCYNCKPLILFLIEEYERLLNEKTEKIND